MTDIVIIGGGIAGISAAAFLAPHAPVTVLEAETSLGYHASGRSAAAFLEHYGNATIRALNRASLPCLHSHGVLKQKGMLLLGKADEAERFAANVADFDLDQIAVSEAHEMVPILNPATCALAATRPNIYDLDTDLLLQAFRKQALAHGAQIVTGARVDRISQDGRWHIRAGDRDWSADTLVNAAGAWADPVAELAGVQPLGIQPFRRSMARIALADGIDASRWPFMDGVDDAWYAKPDAGALLVSPADEDPVPPQDAWADDMILAEGLARYEEMVTEPVTRMIANWAGLRSFAPDRALVVGRDARRPGFVWLAGQGGYGFQTCCAAAQLLAAQLCGTDHDLDAATVAALSPARFG
ncbi:FAD-binding oxidoreductase [Mesobacterium sp. TK19101]|uniref:FAD-binding oxidoreductase n=1 Tax=Mesobacterium hydrothermale TaxID=3111907 RepID=A0ABU6HK91_9RHOB|nr:FAD-binding oxidoreductase [Mesobacterium sp. TK19101]MEC3861863.1 FAD-binding oxidoreductase [Mesobacterium sp. TK19101]